MWKASYRAGASCPANKYEIQIVFHLLKNHADRVESPSDNVYAVNTFVYTMKKMNFNLLPGAEF